MSVMQRMVAALAPDKQEAAATAAAVPKRVLLTAEQRARRVAKSKRSALRRTQRANRRASWAGWLEVK